MIDYANKNMKTGEKTGQIHDLKAVLAILALLVVVAVVTVVRTTSTGQAQHSNPNGGSVTLTAQIRGSKMALDQIAEYTTAKDNDSYTATNLENRPYQFAVVKDGYWPWAKTYTPNEQEEVTFNTFSVLITPKKEDASPDDELYKEYKPQFDALQVATEKNKLVSKNGTMSIWAETNNIYAEWLGEASSTPSYFCYKGGCDTQTDVIHLQYRVRSLAFLDDFNNVIVFADDQGIYVLEIEKSGQQNFQPIFKTPSPQFILTGPRTMMVESNSNIFRISF